jgi:hypothetical protein
MMGTVAALNFSGFFIPPMYPSRLIDSGVFMPGMEDVD